LGAVLANLERFGVLNLVSPLGAIPSLEDTSIHCRQSSITGLTPATQPLTSFFFSGRDLREVT
jgi:hypothetical protein